MRDYINTQHLNKFWATVPAKSEGLLPPSRLRTVRVPFKTYSSSFHLFVCLYDISANLSCLMVLQASCICFSFGSSPSIRKILSYIIVSGTEDKRLLTRKSKITS